MPTEVSAHPRAQDVARRTAELFTAVGEDPVRSERIARSGTVVHVHLGDGAGITLLLDRTPVAAEARIVGEAEIVVRCSPAAWSACLDGDRPLAMAIAHGEAGYDGPVRKLLAVLPILRTVAGPGGRAASPDAANQAG